MRRRFLQHFLRLESVRPMPLRPHNLQRSKSMDEVGSFDMRCLRVTGAVRRPRSPEMLRDVCLGCVEEQLIAGTNVVALSPPSGSNT